MRGGKRKAQSDVVDLTGDSDTENFPVSRKSIKTPQKTSVRQNPTPPSSSQPLRNTQAKTPPSSQAYNYVPRSSQVQDDESEPWFQYTGDMRREINLTQDPDDEDAYENRQLYGIVNTKIVGVRYYNGRATMGEYVVIKREPQNPYDHNAIRVDNVIRQQIGHIPRNMAAKLAGLLDSGDLVVEGALTGAKGEFDCPMALKMFGTNDLVRGQALKTRMEAVNLPVQNFKQAERERQKRMKELEKQQAARAKAAKSMAKNGAKVIDEAKESQYANLNTAGEKMGDSELRLGEVLSDTTIFNPREVQEAVNRFGSTEEALKHMPMADQPQEIQTTLLPYQRQGLQWMLDHESPKLPKKDGDEPVQFWKKQGNAYRNIATSFSVTQGPQLASGGILADDMGLGKTIQVLSLIVADLHKTGQPTLIIAPLSVMSNWKNQAAMHVKTKYTPNVCIYHGQANRGLTPKEFKQYDIVVTTYQTMTMELFTGKDDKPAKVPTSKGLFSVKWRRVVLDEGHQIRNPRAKMSRAAHHLEADSRWVLSGTPIVNNLKDLYSHVKFLRLSGGLSEFDIFNGAVIRPIKLGSESAQILLRALMQTLCLRRMKSMNFVDLRLPALDFHKSVISFYPHEKERYDAFKAEATGLVEEAKAKKAQDTMTHLLEVLLRLRQSCNHWRMCGEDRVRKLLELVGQNKLIDMNNSANVRALQDLLQLKLDNQEDCPVCMEPLTSEDCDPVITPCTHVFCRDCITRAITSQHKCPMCRAELSCPEILIAAAANFGESEQKALKIDPDEESSKTEAIVKLLLATANDKPDSKTVIFSQWTSFLDILECVLARSKIGFTRLDGRLTPLKRDIAIETLTTNPACKVMLASLSACSVGINLTTANQVILADSWWAPAVEDQAVDRVYRLGQTKECRVVRFVMGGSIEEEVLKVQDDKRKLISAAFGEEHKSRERRDRLADIERLLR